MSAAERRVVVITGFSGAGKSTAVRMFEDQGYYCVDNLPPHLFKAVVEYATNMHPDRDLAVVCDARAGRTLHDLGAVLAELRADATASQPFTLFLTADQQTLINRFKETRRRHPLAPDRSVADGIDAERELLEQLLTRADLVIDTTDLSPRQLVERIGEEMLGRRLLKPAVTLRSFGFKYGPLPDADVCVDVRFLPNPHYDPELKLLTGLDPRVAEFAARDGIKAAFYRHLLPMIDFLIPQYIRERKTHIVIAIGCTGGQHRSVAVIEDLAAHLRRRSDIIVSVSHRDITKAQPQHEFAG